MCVHVCAYAIVHERVCECECVFVKERVCVCVRVCMCKRWSKITHSSVLLHSSHPLSKCHNLFHTLWYSLKWPALRPLHGGRLLATLRVCIVCCKSRVGQNHIYTVYIRHFGRQILK